MSRIRMFRSAGWVSSAVQDKVKTAIETMTGLDVSEVNIKIAGVNIDN